MEKSAFEHLWAPWRVEYFENKKDPDFLRRAAEGVNDEENLILFRRKIGFLIMNRYPYTAGHLMAVPYRKVADLEELNGEERLELLNLGIYAKRLLKEVVHADGFNIGWNLGIAGGAGVQEHLHLHIVPRWNGDHNFMTVLGGARIIPEGLKPLYTRLREATQTILFEE
jgi:ATP adenylyltransferase